MARTRAMASHDHDLKRPIEHFPVLWRHATSACGSATGILTIDTSIRHSRYLLFRAGGSPFPYNALQWCLAPAYRRPARIRNSNMSLCLNKASSRSVQTGPFWTNCRLFVEVILIVPETDSQRQVT
jgi:hypothetical protein